MKCKYICLIIFNLCVRLFVNAQDCFRLDSFENVTMWQMEKSPINSNVVYKLPANKKISGLSLSGQVIKNSPEYVVRVVLKDRNGKEYLVLETYEELNSNEVIVFENYGEESLQLDNILPDSIKVFVKNASIQIFSLLAKDEVKDMPSRYQKRVMRQKQIDNAISRINAYNKSNDRPWVAGETELSKLPYETRKRLLGFSDDSPTGGMEYYTSGFFVVGHSIIPPTRNIDDDPFVDSFDWRNRHGKNWVTDIRNQGSTSYCSAFAALGCLESLTKLYFNNSHLELDLSEQEIASCYDSHHHEFWESLTYGGVMNYIYEHGVCDEVTYPLDTAGYFNMYYEPECPNTIISPNLQDIKRLLISKGPLYSGWQRSSNSGHAMTLVGYGKILANDTISQYDSANDSMTTMYNVPSSYIGSTYWIFKNSYGYRGAHNGYYYLVFSDMIGNNSNVTIPLMLLPSSLGLPIISMNHNDDDIIVEDEDGDGYFNWGIGEKPEGCPPWIPDTRDGDDSDNTKGSMNEYGHLSSIPIRETWVLTSDIVLTYNKEMIFGSIVIPNGCTLTLTGSAILMGTTTITVQDGGCLILDGCILANAAINMHSGSSLFLRNGATIYSRKDNDFFAPLGCVVEIEQGEICGPFKIGAY